MSIGDVEGGNVCEREQWRGSFGGANIAAGR